MSELFERAWPLAEAKAGVAIVHGLAEHSGRYEHVAQALNASGYAAYGLDVRGHGRSVGFPGEVGGDVDRVIADVREFAERVAAAHEVGFVLAHSMGTLLALPAVAALPEGTIRGLVLSGTALMPGPAVLDSMAAGEGIPPEKLSRDPAVVDAYKNAPLVFYDRVPPELMGLALEATQRASAAVPLITIPVLLIHGMEDEICDLQGAQYVHTELVGTDKTLKVYEACLHEVLNEPDREQVIADVVAWFDAHLEVAPVT